jgi:hypothetical protein
MTGLEQAALITGAIWLAVVSLVLLLVVRQVGLMTVRLSFAAPNVSADDVGVPAGTSVPHDVAHLVGGNSSAGILVFMSGTCSQCRSIASALSDREVSPSMVFLIAGVPSKARLVGEMLPSRARRLFEPEASNVANALAVDTVPFALRISAARVGAKTYLQSAADLSRFRERSANPSNAGNGAAASDDSPGLLSVISSRTREGDGA